MSQSTVELHIPTDVYERAQQIARESNRSIESVLLDGLNLLFGTLSTIDLSPDVLETYTDEQLWAMVYHRLTWPQDTRLRELVEIGKRGQLSADEHAEMERLLVLVDRYMLLRSKALLLLKQRGHDIEQRLQLGV